MAAVIHIAGFPVRVGGHKRQRCAWCGVLLVDSIDDQLACTPPPPPGERVELAHWQPNALVRVDGPMSSIVTHVDGDPIPAGWCGDEGKTRLRVVEEPAT